MGQSPTWGCPAPQVRLGKQFWWFKFRSQQRHLANQSGKLSETAPKFHLGGSTLAPITFLFVDKSSRSFFAQCGRGCSWSATFPIFDRLIRSGDIRDQSGKLSEIVPNFALLNFRGRAFPKSCAHPCLAARHVEKFRDVTPTSPKVIGANTLNFKPNFTCSPLNFLGDPRPR